MFESRYSYLSWRIWCEFFTKNFREKQRMSFPSTTNKWVFPKIVVPQNGWFIMEDLIKMDDLGGKPTIFGNPQIQTKVQKNSAASNFETKIFFGFQKYLQVHFRKHSKKSKKCHPISCLFPEHFPPTGLVLCGCRE